MSNKTINEKEFEKLVKKLTERKNKSEGNLTIKEVLETLTGSDLLDVYEEGDIESILLEKQKRRSKLSIIITIISAIILLPLSVFGGYKAKEIALTFDNSTTTTINNYETTVQNLKQENSGLEEQFKEIQEENQELEEENKQKDQKIDQLTNRIADIQTSGTATSGSSALSAEPGSILKPGETWVQDGMEMKVSEVSFKPGCDKAFVQFDISIANRSGADLETDIVGGNFYVTVDNKPYSNFSWNKNLAIINKCTTTSNSFYTSNLNYQNRYLMTSNVLSIPELKSEQKEEYYLVFWDNIYDLNQEIVFHVKEAGNIKNAKWRLNPDN